jgi:hypothetical protein
MSNMGIRRRPRTLDDILRDPHGRITSEVLAQRNTFGLGIDPANFVQELPMGRDAMEELQSRMPEPDFVPEGIPQPMRQKYRNDIRKRQAKERDRRIAQQYGNQVPNFNPGQSAPLINWVSEDDMPMAINVQLAVQFDAASVGTPLAGTQNVTAGSANVPTTVSQLGVLGPGRYVSFASQVGVIYQVQAITALAITLTGVYTGASNVATTGVTPAPGAPVSPVPSGGIFQYASPVNLWSGSQGTDDVSIYARIEWGSAGATHVAYCDFQNGTQLRLTGSFVRVSALYLPTALPAPWPPQPAQIEIPPPPAAPTTPTGPPVTVSAILGQGHPTFISSAARFTRSFQLVDQGFLNSDPIPPYASAFGILFASNTPAINYTLQVLLERNAGDPYPQSFIANESNTTDAQFTIPNGVRFMTVANLSTPGSDPLPISIVYALML